MKRGKIATFTVRWEFLWALIGIGFQSINTTFTVGSSSKTFKRMTFDLAQRLVRLLTRQGLFRSTPRDAQTCLHSFRHSSDLRHISGARETAPRECGRSE